MSEETIRCDVLVAGGGPAGMAAAVAAARTGARTVLLECYGFLGGLATAGMVGTICGLYPRAPGKKPRPLFGGFVRQWTDRLARAPRASCASRAPRAPRAPRACASQPVEVAPGLYALPYDPWVFMRLADETVRDTKGLEVGLHATVSAVCAERSAAVPGRVTEVSALVWNRLVAFRPSALVDCTGEATLVRLAGGPVEDGGARQTPAVVFTIQLASPGPETAGERMAVLRLIRKACDENILGQACSRVSFVPATPGGRTVSLKLGLSAGDLARWNGMTDLEIEARQRVDEICRFLIGEAPAFRGARLCRSATQVGIRTGGRIRGEARLAGSDVLECRRFADGVVQGAWPIEEWRDGARPEMTHLPEGEHYEIPAGCLCVENMENVFAAGRCISASERALASARVMGIALGTGWAAGKLAAFHAAGRPRSEAVEEVRAELAPAPDAT